MVFVLAIASAATYGAADFFGGIASRRASTLAVVLLSQFAGLVLLLAALPLLPDANPSSGDLVWGGAAGLSGGVGVALLYRALAVGKMASVAPTTAVCAVAIPVIVAMVLGERPSPRTLSGMVLALVAIVLVSQQRTPQDTALPPSRTGPLPPGIGLALVSGVAIGLFFLSLARTSPAAGVWPLLSARTLSVALFGLIAIARRSSIGMERPAAVIAIGGGSLDMLANALYLFASRAGPLSVVVTLSSLYPASTVLLARLVLREQLNAWQGAGLVCALTAVILIVGGA